MSPRVLRRIVVLVFVSGIAGMIVGSIKDSNGFAITFGLVTAVAALGLILITAVAPPGSLVRRPRGDHDPTTPTATERAVAPDEATARDLEARVQALVDAGADEEQVRLLVRRAIDFGEARAGDRSLDAGGRRA